MEIQGHDIGVCSWSLQAADMASLVEAVRGLGLSHVQLALAPILFLDDTRKREELGHLRNSGLTVTGGTIYFPGEDYSTINRIRQTGGFVPDETWPIRRKITEDAGRLCQEMGLKLLSAHIGFVPGSNHPDYRKIIDRVGDAAKVLAGFGVDLCAETGQETAPELLQFINDLPTRTVHVNFDAANMVLYGADDPIEAIQTLGRHIRHVHVKDAIRSKSPGDAWGEEVPFGQGAVQPQKFLDALNAIGYTGPLVIERDRGGERPEEILAAIEVLNLAAEGEWAEAVD